MKKISKVLTVLLALAFATNAGAMTEGSYYTVEEARSMLPELPEGTCHELDYAFSKACETYQEAEETDISFVANSLMASRVLQQRIETLEDICRDVTDQIEECELVPGDIGVQCIEANGNKPMHTGIFIAQREDGRNIWIHCVTIDGIQQVVIEAYDGFEVFYHPFCGDMGYMSSTN